jgi:NADPH-dependent ferric siderophore reductase
MSEDARQRPHVISSAGEPALRRLFVRGAYRLTPNLQRVVFEGPDLANYRFHRESFGPFVKLLIPGIHQRDQIRWPKLSDGHLVWPDDSTRPFLRTYTVRDFDDVLHLLTIDFVLHEPDGPASAFARNARKGDQIAMLDRGLCTPGGFDHYLLVGDHSALPAIAQIVSNAPEPGRMHVAIALADATDRVEFDDAKLAHIQWIVEPSSQARHRAWLGLVEHQMMALEGEVYVWAGGEHVLMADLRVTSKRAGLSQTHILRYWRSGFDEGGNPI